MTHSTFDPVMRDLDRYLQRCDAAAEDTVDEDFRTCLEEAEHLLDRALRAWESGQRKAGLDLLTSAAAVLHDAKDIDLEFFDAGPDPASEDR